MKRSHSTSISFIECLSAKMILTIERTPRTLTFGTAVLHVEELGLRLPFTRKPVSLDDIGGTERMKVYVTETTLLTPEEFDAFADSLLSSCDWLRGKGGTVRGGYLCVEVAAMGRPYLYVNPEGSSYARYIARLG
jgi:hypothetical protein